jgi:hypothetical protein
MQLIFVGYEPLQKGDTGGVAMTRVHIVTPDPDADMQGRSDGYVDLTDASITGAANVAAFWTLVKTELGRVYRRNAVKAKLDPFINATDTV